MAGPPRPQADAPFLIGRERERARLRSLVDALAAGRGDSVILVGEAGIGKTSLAVEAADQARRAGLHVAVGSGIPFTIEQPLQPVLAALGERDDVVSRTLLEATVADPVTLLVQRTIDRLDVLVDSAPLLLVLEDLQWVDPATLTLLHHHLTRVDRRALSIVATSRPPSPGTPLHHLLGAAGPAVVGLDGLDEREVGELVSLRFGAVIDRVDHEALGAASGNPLLVEAIVARSLDAPAGERAATDPVAAVVLGLPGVVLSLLQTAAVAGTEVGVDLLVSLSGQPTSVVLERLAVAIGAGALKASGDRLAFRHDLYRTAVLDTLPAGARAALHLEIARELERIGAPTIEIAEHIARGARPGNRGAVDRLIAAAEELLERDPSTSLRITDLALGLLTQLDVPLRLQAVRIAGLAACGQAAEAELLGRTLLRATPPPEVEARVRRDLALATFLAGRPAESEVHMTRVLELGTDPQATARARTELAWAQFLSLDRAGAMTGASRGRDDGDLATQLAAESLLGWLGLWGLDLDLARSAAEFLVPAVRLAPRGEWQIFQPLLTVAAVRLELGEHDAALAAAADGRHAALVSGSGWAVPAYDALAATVHLRRGELDRAITAASTALHATAIVDGFGVEIWARALLADIALRRGDGAGARPHIEAARLAGEDGRAQLGTNHLVIAEAALARHDDDPSGVSAALEGGWAYLSAVGSLYVRCAVGAELARERSESGDGAGAAAIADELADDARRAPLPLVVAAAARARAWVERTDAAAALAVDTAERCEDATFLLDTLRDAVRLAPCATTARAWRQRESELVGGFAGAPTPAAPSRSSGRRDRPAFGPDSLTDAERRVAVLVAQGLTNAKIAAQLVVSRRTVDTQVLSAYRKLGVSSRVALTRALLDESGE